MEVAEAITNVGQKTRMGDDPKLPLDLILLVFDIYPFEKIFSLLEIGVLREVFVGKVNNGDRLESKHLEYLGEHPQVCERLRKLDVLCATERDVILFESICSRSPSLQCLTLGLSEQYLTQLKDSRQILRSSTKLTVDISDERKLLTLDKICQRAPRLALKLQISEGLQNLQGHHFILERLTKLYAIHPRMQDFVTLKNICQQNPLKITKIKMWLYGTSLMQSLSKSAEILKQLTYLEVSYPNVDDLPSLRAICTHYAVKLDMRTPVHMKELIEYQEILESLTNLRVLYPVGEEDLDWLNNVCRMSPNLSSLKFEMKGALQPLLECSHVLAHLVSLKVCLLDKDSCSRFKELCERCPKLQDYTIKTHPLFFGYHEDYPMMTGITIYDDLIAINGEKSNQSMKAQCRLNQLYLLAQLANLPHLTELQLTYTDEEEGENFMFPLLEHISKESQNLDKLVINWGKPRSSIQLTGSVGKALEDWKSLQSLVVTCPQQLRPMLERKWTKNRIDLPEIAQWTETE